MHPFAFVFCRRRSLASVSLCAVMSVGQSGILQTRLQQQVVEMIAQVVDSEPVEHIRRLGAAPCLLECWSSGFDCGHFVASSEVPLPRMRPDDIFALIQWGGPREIQCKSISGRRADKMDQARRAPTSQAS